MCCYQQCTQDSFHSTTESQALEGTSRAPLKAKALLQTARENTQVGFEYLQRTLCHLPGQFELCRSQSLPGTPPAPLRAHRPPSRRWAPPKGARRHPSDPPLLPISSDGNKCRHTGLPASKLPPRAGTCPRLDGLDDDVGHLPAAQVLVQDGRPLAGTLPLQAGRDRPAALRGHLRSCVGGDKR